MLSLKYKNLLTFSKFRNRMLKKNQRLRHLMDEAHLVDLNIYVIFDVLKNV